MDPIHMNQYGPCRELPRKLQTLELFLDLLDDRGFQLRSGELDLAHIDRIETCLDSEVDLAAGLNQGFALKEGAGKNHVLGRHVQALDDFTTATLAAPKRGTTPLRLRDTAYAELESAITKLQAAADPPALVEPLSHGGSGMERMSISTSIK